MASLAALTGVMVILGQAAVAAETDPAATCTQPAITYQGWTIRNLDLTSPFEFVPAVKSLLSSVAGTLPLQKSNGFDAEKYHQGPQFLSKAVQSKLPFKFTTLSLVVVTDRLKNCDQAARSLDVEYLVYTVFIPSHTGRTFEKQQEGAEKPATSGGITASSGKLLAIPNFAYDHTRHGFGGMRITSQAPLGIFDDLNIDSTASTNSLAGNIELGGKRTLKSRLLHEVDWKLLADYSDIPTGTQRLKEATLSASFFGSSQPLNTSGLVLNYAASLAGGHQQTSLLALPNTSYGDLKFLLDIQAYHGASAFSGAYGIQLGTTLGERSVDFVKHIVDLRHSFVYSPMPKYKPGGTCRSGDPCDDRASFIGAAHRPFMLETRLGAGVIQKLGIVPSPERFFGGNQRNAPFIEGQPWEISSQPYIRSIPAYQIGSNSTASFGLGGTRFYALNLTASKAVAGRAILPKELGQSRDEKNGGFIQVLDGSINTATGKISDTYFAADPAVLELNLEIKTLGDKVAQIKLPDTTSFDSATKTKVTPIIGSINLRMKLAAINVANILAGKGNPLTLFQLIPPLDSDLEKLQNVLSGSPQSALAGPLKEQQKAIDDAFYALDQAWRNGTPGSNQTPIQAARARADARATADLAPARKVLNTVLYQLNLYSIAPVAVFDVARVWPTGVGTRYAVGGGVRLSLVNTNFTIGYAFNPHRLPGEGPGAMFFQLDITNLFH